MTSTNISTARLPRFTTFGLLALVLALVFALPGAAGATGATGAKKHSKPKCPGAHAKTHKAKVKYKRCMKRLSRHGSARSPANRPAGQTAKPTAAEVAACRQEQAIDPEGFAETYGADDPLEECEQHSKGSTQETNDADDTLSDNVG